MAEKAKKSTKSTKTSSPKSSTPVKSNVSSNVVKAPKEKISLKNSKIILVVVVIFVLILILLYLFKGVFIAATVNGEPISRIAVVKTLEKQNGAMILENLITKKLILQEARNRNINITQEDLDNEVKTISESLKKQGTTLEKAMESQGMTRSELDEELKVQLALRKMTEADIKVTDKEIEDFVTTNQAQFPEGTTDAEMKEMAKTQLTQQMSAEKSQALIEELQKKAKINHFSGY